MRNEERRTFSSVARRPAAAHPGSVLNVLFPEQSRPSHICSLPVQVGNGAAQLPRFFYNANTRTCQPFIYSGKGGNQVYRYICIHSKTEVIRQHNVIRKWSQAEKRNMHNARKKLRLSSKKCVHRWQACNAIVLSHFFKMWHARINIQINSMVPST